MFSSVFHLWDVLFTLTNFFSLIIRYLNISSKGLFFISHNKKAIICDKKIDVYNMFFACEITVYVWHCHLTDYWTTNSHDPQAIIWQFSARVHFCKALLLLRSPVSNTAIYCQSYSCCVESMAHSLDWCVAGVKLIIDFGLEFISENRSEQLWINRQHNSLNIMLLNNFPGMLNRWVVCVFFFCPSALQYFWCKKSVNNLFNSQ